MKKRLFLPVKIVGILLLFVFGACSRGDEDPSPNPNPSVPPAPVTPADFPFSDLGSGRLLYASDGETFGSLVLADNSGKTISKFNFAGLHTDYKISPYGELITYSGKIDLVNDQYGIFVSTSAGKNAKRLMAKDKNGFNPGWSPDGSKIVFWRVEGTTTTSYSLNSISKDGTNLIKLTDQNTNLSFSTPSVAGSGIMTFSTNQGYGNPTNPAGVYLFLPSTKKLERIIPLEAGKFYESPAFSPDGTKIAFLRVTRIEEEYKLIEVILWNVDAKSSKVLTTVNAFGKLEYNALDIENQVYLAWSPDGSKIVFNVPEGDLTSHLYVVNSDGSNLKKITNGAKTTDFKVSWGR